MAWEARIERDSISPGGHRLTTAVATYPRFIHSELLTHRAFSRNSASSRAIPFARMLKRVLDDPVEPIHWGQNQSGMQAEAELPPERQAAAREAWHRARLDAVVAARNLADTGCHKQVVNRLLEPYSWMTTILTATDDGWANFFALRTHRDAQPEFQHIARMLWREYKASTPAPVGYGEWHLPFIRLADWHAAEDDVAELRRWSAARCARVSYLLHDGKETTPAEDEQLFWRLAWSVPRHMSPLEHQAMPLTESEEKEYGAVVRSNLTGWYQFRKEFADECIREFRESEGES